MSDKPKSERAMKIAATKARKEAEAIVALEAARCAALRRTVPVARDLPIPDAFGVETSGWDFNAYTGHARRVWSERCFHGDGAKKPSIHAGSQGGVALFSTKALALAALRHAVERECADKLLAIDKQIAETASERAPIPTVRGEVTP